MAGGRPTTYTPEMLEKANAYLEAWKDEGDMIPSVVGLVKYIERSKTCVYEWAKDDDKKEFKDILDRINEVQRQVLINKGLSGDFNSNITKLVLGKHGFSEKRELSGDPDKPVQVIAREMSADEATAAYRSIVDD
jgi:hypothetical protein